MVVGYVPVSAPGRHRPPLPCPPRALQNNEKLFQGRHETGSKQIEKLYFDFFSKMQKNVRSLSSPALAAAATEPSLHSRHEYSF